MIIPGGQWRRASASQVWKLPAGAWGPRWLLATVNFSISKPGDGESVPKWGPRLSPGGGGDWGARPPGSRVSVPVCRAGVSPARWPVMLLIPPPRSSGPRGLGASRDDARMPGMSRCQAGGILSLPASPRHRSGVGLDPSPFPPLNGSSRLCLEGLLPAK